jgi:MFS family permease
MESHKVAGVMTGFAATQAYIADCTDSVDRSRAFSLYMGALFIGIALGPQVGSLLAKRTGSLLAIYYFATAIYTLYGIALFVVVPQSRSAVQMAASRRRYALECDTEAARNHSRWMRIFSNVTQFARPLVIFIPRRTVDSSNSGELGRRNYGLLLVVCAQLSVYLLAGGLDFKIQYVLAKFRWTSVETGYWITLIGVTRTIHLAVILPCELFNVLPLSHLMWIVSDIQAMETQGTTYSTSSDRRGEFT